MLDSAYCAVQAIPYAAQYWLHVLMYWVPWTPFLMCTWHVSGVSTHTACVTGPFIMLLDVLAPHGANARELPCNVWCGGQTFEPQQGGSGD